MLQITQRAMQLALLLAAAGAQLLLDLPWTMEGGTQYRESAVAYNGLANRRGAARYWFYSLNENVLGCDKSVPETASATPVSYESMWIVGTCTNELVFFANPELGSLPSGMLTPLRRPCDC